MRLLKRLLASDAVRRAAAGAIARYIRLIRRTGRWTTENGAVPDQLMAAQQPFIVAFWHGRLLMLTCAWPYPTPMNLVISEHRDGRLIAEAVAGFGLATIAGSTTRGGARVFRQIVRLLKDGACVGITPDGPRGPRMRASPGIIQAARLSGAPIVPLCYAAAPRRVIRSWDRFVVPLPFARGVIAWGEPIEVPRDADDAAQEALRRLLEDRLNAQARGLDERLACPPIEPAPEPQPAPQPATAAGAP
ncbi:MAG: lysophospholipid acyltransferase family protein [Rhodospirillaceae bacterium]